MCGCRLWTLSCGNWRLSRLCSRWTSSRHSCQTPSSSAEVLTHSTPSSLFSSFFHSPISLSQSQFLAVCLALSFSSSLGSLFLLFFPHLSSFLFFFLYPYLPPSLSSSSSHLFLSCSSGSLGSSIFVNTGDYDAIQVLMLLPRIIFKADLVTDQLKQQACIHCSVLYIKPSCTCIAL